MREGIFEDKQIKALGFLLQDRIIKSVTLYLEHLEAEIGAEKIVNLRQLPQGLSLGLTSGERITVYYDHLVTEKTSNHPFKFTGILSEYPDETKIFQHLNINLGLGRLTEGVSLFDTEIFRRENGFFRRVKLKPVGENKLPGDILCTDFSSLEDSAGVNRKANIIKQVYLNFSEKHYNSVASVQIDQNLWLIHSLTEDCERLINYNLYLQNFPYTFGSRVGEIPKEEIQINVMAQILRLRAHPRKEGPAEINYDSDGGPRAINREAINLYLTRTDLTFLKPEVVLQKILTSQADLRIDVGSFYRSTVEPLLKYF